MYEYGWQRQKIEAGNERELDFGGMESDPHIHVFGLLKRYIHRQYIPHTHSAYCLRKLPGKSTLSFYYPQSLCREAV